jgi:hypothetical protein
MPSGVYIKTEEHKRKMRLNAEKFKKEFTVRMKEYWKLHPILRREKSPKWKGGKIYQYGYVCIYLPEHPRARGGYVRRSHLVMEKHLGRYLTREEVVHHINGIKDDDRIENLKLLKDKREHYFNHIHLRSPEAGRYI